MEVLVVNKKGKGYRLTADFIVPIEPGQEKITIKTQTQGIDIHKRFIPDMGKIRRTNLNRWGIEIIKVGKEKVEEVTIK